VRGRFITFEGTEGAGKSTQIRLLADDLRASGRRVLLTREPGGTAFGRALRAMLLDPGAGTIAPWAELFLYLADRSQHTREVIAPSLQRGEWLLCDRFADATVAYQGYGRGLDPSFIVEASEYPDLVRKYRVSGVPKTMVNEKVEILGAQPEEDFVRTAVSARDSA